MWWKKPLASMSQVEWESLCDGCGLCCLNKVEDEDTGEVFLTNVHCQLFAANSCRCGDYSRRKALVPHCLVLTPELAASLTWLPKTCAYRLLSHGEELPAWHHLVCGSRERVHEEGKSAKRMKLISEVGVADLREHIEVEM